MPRYFCDYCDVYLTHDSFAGRSQHNRGAKHREFFKQFYQNHMVEWQTKQNELHAKKVQEEAQLKELEYQKIMEAQQQQQQQYFLQQQHQMNPYAQMPPPGAAGLPAPPGAGMRAPPGAAGLPAPPGAAGLPPPPGMGGLGFPKVWALIR